VYGCQLYSSYDCSLHGNLFLRNEIGLYYQWAVLTDIYLNEFRNNTNGIYFDMDNHKLKVRENNFINNAVQAGFFFDESMLLIPDLILNRLIYGPQYRHNYWSDWESLQRRPIKGNVTLWIRGYYHEPIFTSSVIFDWHPAQKP